MRVFEPTTTLTDVLLAVVYGLAAVALARAARRTGARSQRWLAASFAVTAVAAALGSVSHGFGPSLPVDLAAAVWLATIWSIGVAAYLLLRCTFEATLGPRGRTWLGWAAGAQLVWFLSWTLRHRDFFWVVLDYLPAMALVLLLQVGAFRRGERSAGWIAAGVIVSLVGAVVQQSGLALHRHFNHNDLYHVVQMGAAWLLYRGGVLLRDRALGSEPEPAS